MRNINIRSVNECDAQFLHTLMNNESILSVLNEVPTTLKDWADAIVEWKLDSDELDYIVFKEDLPIGWLGINGLLSEDKKVYIKLIALLPQYQNSGIGQYAINEIASELKRQGYVSISLYTDQSNIQAQQCYLKCGFNIVNDIEQKMSNGLVMKRYKMECIL